MGDWTETIDAGSPQNEQDLQPLQPFDLQPDLWCSHVLRKHGFFTLQVPSQETPVGPYCEDAYTACLCFLNGQSLCTLQGVPQDSVQPLDT